MDPDDYPTTEVRLAIELVEQGAEPAAQLAAPRLLARRPADHQRFEPGNPHLQRGQIALVLIGEIVIERLPIEPGSVQNRAYRGGVVALSANRLEHSLENLFALGRIHKLELG